MGYKRGVMKLSGRVQHVLIEQGWRVLFVHSFVFCEEVGLSLVLQLTLKGGVESMLLHYCPEVKSVEEVVSSEIEEVICCFFLNPPSALSLQRAGKQFSAQICRGHDWRSRGIILILVVEAPVNNRFEINLSPSGNATHWLQSQINSSRKMARGCSVRLDDQKIYDLSGCRGQLRQKKRFNENISTTKHRRAEHRPTLLEKCTASKGTLGPLRANVRDRLRCQLATLDDADVPAQE